jgi:hypothetical protein
LLAGACSRTDPVAAEIACQQRLVEIPTRILATPQAHAGKAVARVYEQISRAYAAMPLDGCTEDQRGQARSLARTLAEIAGDFTNLPDAKSADATSVQASAKYMDLRMHLEGFENRRILMQQDLEKMRAVRLR